MFSVSWLSSTGLFVQTMCLIDRHLQVFSPFCLCMYLSVLISSIHRSRERPMFDLYLGRPITSDIPTISIRETFCCLPIVAFSYSFDRPNIYLSIVFALADDEMNIHSSDEREEKGKEQTMMKTSSSEREQIDSDHLSPSFSRTIIWRCYRREKGREQSAGKRPTDARATKTKHWRYAATDGKREEEKTTVTANHGSMMYNNNRTPFPSFFFSRFYSLYLSFLFGIHICCSWP